VTNVGLRFSCGCIDLICIWCRLFSVRSCEPILFCGLSFSVGECAASWSSPCRSRVDFPLSVKARPGSSFGVIVPSLPASELSSSLRLSRPASVFSSASILAACLCCFWRPSYLLFAAQGTSFATRCFSFDGSALSGPSCRSQLPLFSACVLRTPARLASVVILLFCWVH
jgi:hypothetical protein